MKEYHIKQGEKYERLTCLSFHHIGDHNRSYFLFNCDCGKDKVLLGSHVKSGNTKSCGCLGVEVRKSQRLSNDRGVIYQIILGYKRHALGRNKKWLLDLDQVRGLVVQPCHYCGLEYSNIKKTKNYKEGFNYNGIDRVDSIGDYTPDNTVPCCNLCNKAKMAMSKQDFISWITRVYHHQQKAMATQWGGKELAALHEPAYQLEFL